MGKNPVNHFERYNINEPIPGGVFIANDMNSIHYLYMGRKQNGLYSVLSPWGHILLYADWEFKHHFFRYVP